MNRRTEKLLRRLLMGTLYGVSLSAMAVWFWRGMSYYALQPVERPRHAAHMQLSSSGEWGHLYGLIGSALILVLLLYSLRKRWRALDRAGTLRTWLDVHIWMGITGPLLIILHSAFKVRGIVAFSFWSMAAVALSGVLGRYLYLQIPRDESGEELDGAGIQLRQDLLLGEAGLSVQTLPEIIRLDLQQHSRGMLSWVLDDLSWISRRRRWRQALRSAGLPDGAPELRALRKMILLQRRRLTLDLARRLLHYWHVFHRPFAVIMIIFMLIHVVVVLLFGSRWLHGVAS